MQRGGHAPLAKEVLYDSTHLAIGFLLHGSAVLGVGLGVQRRRLLDVIACAISFSLSRCSRHGVGSVAVRGHLLGAIARDRTLLHDSLSSCPGILCSRCVERERHRCCALFTRVVHLR